MKIKIFLKKKHKRLILLLCLFSLIFIFFNLGVFLTFNQESQDESDIIIALSGESGRVNIATKLYWNGYGSYLVLSNYKEWGSKHGDMLQTALSLGIPREAIITEDAAQSTYENAKYTLPIMQEHGFKSAIVVSSDFHMRRVKFNFDRVYKGSGIKLTYVGADSGYNANFWWADSYSRSTTLNEYAKLIGNAFGYDGPEAKATLSRIKKWFQW